MLAVSPPTIRGLGVLAAPAVLVPVKTRPRAIIPKSAALTLFRIVILMSMGFRAHLADRRVADHGDGFHQPLMRRLDASWE
ncbi:hypothetical protein GCM10009569_08200 [Arthrobacter russicus]